MHVVVLGGTWFIGRAVVSALVRAGHRVTVVHRGRAEPADLPEVDHVHLDRAELTSRHLPGGVDGVVDVSAMTGAHAGAAIAATPGASVRVVLSSCDVYRAFSSVHARVVTDPVPLREDAPLRAERNIPATGGCENLDIEEAYLPVGGVGLRLGAVYGPHDYLRRHEAVLRRLRVGRTRIPIGAGTFLFSQVYVDDVAGAVLLALGNAELRGRAFNIAEPVAYSTEHAMRRTLAAAAGLGAGDAELVRVPDGVVPQDLTLTRAIPQHLVVSGARFAALTGWRTTDPEQALQQSIRWHLDHPPDDPDGGFAADDTALASADGSAISR